MPIGIYKRTEYHKRRIKQGKINENHKVNCPCGVCQAKRGEFKGQNNPMFGIKLLKEKNGNYGKRHKGLNSGKNNPMYGRPCPSKVNSYKGGYYKNIWMRSSWEIAYAKYLDENNIDWKYEYKTFNLGESTYTPDFYLTKTKEYIEIKGYWREGTKEKFELFKQLYPNIKITIIGNEKLKELKIL
jgi:hypothetical protein